MGKTSLDRGLEKGHTEGAADSEHQPTGLLRGFTGALSALARSLARAETPQRADSAEEDASGTEAEIAGPILVKSNVAPITREDFEANPQPTASPTAHPLTEVRSGLLSLLTELEGDEPAPQGRAVMDHDAAEGQRANVEGAATYAADAATGSTSFAILSGKTVGVIGFSETRGIQLGQALAAQRCSFVTFDHADAEFRKGATGACDVLLVEARPEWTEIGSGEVSSLLASKKPVVVLGGAQSLITMAVIAQGGPREFVASPCGVEELIWRTAILLSRIPGPKVRGRKKNRVAQIVIGDDDASSRTLVHAILAQEGMKCHAADNGAQALALARAKSADVVVVDVNMPGLDGFQVLAEIKRDPALAGVHVILLTTRQGEADVLRGFGLGAEDYVTKPFSPLELAARVKRLLARPA